MRTNFPRSKKQSDFLFKRLNEKLMEAYDKIVDGTYGEYIRIKSMHEKINHKAKID